MKKNEPILIIVISILLLSITTTQVSALNIHDNLYVLWQNWTKPVAPDFTYHTTDATVPAIWNYCPNILDASWNSACLSSAGLTINQIKSQNPVTVPMQDGFTFAMLYYSYQDNFNCGSWCDMFGYGPFNGAYSPAFPNGATFMARKNFNDESTLNTYLRLNDSICSANFAGGGSFYGVSNHLLIVSYSTTTGNMTCTHNGVSCGTVTCSGAPVNVSNNYIGPGAIGRGGGTPFFKFYQFAVWNRELSSTEKSELYNGGSFLALNETIPPFDPYDWTERNMSRYDDYYEHILWNNPLYTTHAKVEDLDSDGLNDIFLVSQNYGMIYFKNINNTWGVSDPYITIDATYDGVTDEGLRLGDLNGDNCTDIAFIDPGTQPPKWLEGHCNGTYNNLHTLPNSYTTYYSHAFKALGMGDIDKDGDMDLVSHSTICPISNCGSAETRYIFLWKNNGTGTFTQYHIANSTQSSIPESFIVEDWNQDGNVDIVGGTSNGVCHFYTHDGVGNFARSTLSNCGYYINIEDINNDYYPDILASRSSDVAWIENLGGTGSWTPHIVPGHDGGYFDARVVAEDVNFDNFLDIFSIDGNVWKLFYSTNNGTGLDWSGPYDILKPNYSDHYTEWQTQYYYMDFGDITGDGKDELVTAGEFPFIYFNGNTIPPGYICVPDWSCTNYTACQINDKKYCTAVEDLNLCGTPYTGNYSEIPSNTCDYCTPNITGCLSFGACTTSDVLPCLALNDTNNCYSLTGLPSDNPNPSIENGICDYCTPNIGWNWSNWTYAGCTPVDEDANYRVGEYEDLNACYSQTGLPSDNTGIEYCEGIPSCTDINNNVCHTLGPGKSACCATWGCAFNPMSWLCEGTTSLPDCPEAGCFSYTVEDLQVVTSGVQGCYYNSNISVDIDPLGNPCNFCTLGPIEPMYGGNTTFDIRYGVDGEWLYPSYAFCGVDGYQRQWVGDMNFHNCCELTGLPSDCYNGITTSTNGVYLASSRACEDVFYYSENFNYVGPTYTHGEINSTPLRLSMQDWYHCETGSVYNPGVWQHQVASDVPFSEWYLCTHGGAFAGSNYVTSNGNDMSFWLRSTSYTGAGLVWHKNFDFTNNTRITMDVNSAYTRSYLSFQNASGKGGFILPLGTGSCGTATPFDAQTGNTNDITCCDAVRTTVPYKINKTIQQLIDACPTQITPSHYTNLRQIELLVADGGGSFSNNALAVDNLIITPYDGFVPIYSTPPNISNVVAKITETNEPLLITNGVLENIPAGTNVTFTITPSIDIDGDAITYYQMNCGTNCSCVPVPTFYGTGFSSMYTSGGNTYYPNDINEFRCVWNDGGAQNITISITDNGEISRNMVWGNSGPAYTVPYVSNNVGYSTSEVISTYLYSGPSCGNTICDFGSGENYITCPSDCDSYCGDDICNTNLETYLSCPQDGCFSFCGDGICDVQNENPGACLVDCPEGGLGGGGEPKQELICNPGVEFTKGQPSIITDFKNIETPLYVRETTNPNTCGVDANQDGIMCDLSEDFISCPLDCNFNLAELICIHSQRCMWTESWAVQIMIILQMMLALYMTYKMYLE